MSFSDQNEPLNLLSLDGGGVRGVSELVILDRIMRRLQEREGLEELPKPCDYFDLIAGTSTGGLIAILLGRLQMTTKEALETYDNVAKDIFCGSNRKSMRKVGSRFKASTLKQVVEKVVAQRGGSDLMQDPERANQKGKAFVCAVEADELDAVHCFRTYEVEGHSDQWLKDCKIWEAARATTAAPIYFKGMKIQRGPVAKTFVDAALGYNNPSEELLDEAGRIFHTRRKLGSILSLGTGTRPKRLTTPEDVGHFASVVSTVKSMKDLTVDTEKPHQRLEKKFTDFPSTYFRFNVPGGAEKVGLADWEKMGELKDLTTQYIKQEDVEREIDDIVDVIAQKKTTGLTLGHITRLDKGQLLMDSKVARTMGSASRKFVGRKDTLHSLDTCFSVRDPGQKTRRQYLLCGMGGAGKTQIALKFAETRGERFKYVFWVDAENLATATQSFKDIAVAEMPEGFSKRPSMKDVHAWIASLKEEWLLILDNSNAEYIQEIIPPGNRGNIIFTSRHRDLGLSLPGNLVAVVEDLELQDAITLLLDAAELVTYSPLLREEGAHIAKELGCLALALDQAGSYINQMGCTLGDYLQLYRSHREILLKNPRFKGADPRNQTVYATFDISFQAVKALANDQKGSVESDDARSALDILSIICFYHNESIPAEIFNRAAPNLECTNENAIFYAPNGTPIRGSLEKLLTVDRQGAWDSMPFQYGVVLLERFSLINLDDTRRYLSTHVLVHSWARDRMSESDRIERGLAAAKILYTSSPYSHSYDSATIFFQQKIIPHFKALLENLEGEYANPDWQGDLELGMACLAEQAEDLATAEQLYKTALDTFEQEHGLDAKKTLTARQSLARVHEEQGRYREAEMLRLEVFERQERTLGETAEPTLLAMYDLVGTYIVQSRRDVAAMMWRKIIERKMRLYNTNDPNHMAVARDCAELESMLNVDQDTERRLKSATKALEDRRREHGGLHPATMNAMKHLATLLQEELRYDEAEALYRECYSWCVALYGKEHRTALLISASYYELVSDRGDPITAEGCLRIMLADYQRLFGPRDLDTVQCLYFLGTAIMRQGRFDEGILLREKATELRNSILGADHAYVVAGRETNAEMLEHARNTGPEERRRLGRRALEIWDTSAPHTDEGVDAWTCRKHCNTTKGPNPQPELIYLTNEEINRPNRFPNHFEVPVKHQLQQDVELLGLAPATAPGLADEFV